MLTQMLSDRSNIMLRLQYGLLVRFKCIFTLRLDIYRFILGKLFHILVTVRLCYQLLPKLGLLK